MCIEGGRYGEGGGGVLIITKVYYLISPDLIVTLYIIYRSPRCTKPSIPGHTFLVAFTCHASAIRTLKALLAIRARKKKLKVLLDILQFALLLTSDYEGWIAMQVGGTVYNFATFF